MLIAPETKDQPLAGTIQDITNSIAVNKRSRRPKHVNTISNGDVETNIDANTFANVNVDVDTSTDAVTVANVDKGAQLNADIDKNTDAGDYADANGDVNKVNA